MYGIIEAIEAAVLPESEAVYAAVREIMHAKIDRGRLSAFAAWLIALAHGDSSLPVPIPHVLLVAFRDYVPEESIDSIVFQRCEDCLLCWPHAKRMRPLPADWPTWTPHSNCSLPACPACGGQRIVVYGSVNRMRDAEELAEMAGDEITSDRP